MNEKLSIIIPAYNAEKHISRCIKSILNQHYYNIEVIVVNDGSSDATTNVVEDILKEDSRVKLITQKNTGVSSARNVGLQHATGDYIGFADADDFLEENSYGEIIQKMNETRSEICIFSYYEVKNELKEKIYFPWNEEIKVLDSNSFYKEVLPLYISKLKSEKKSLWGTVWRTIFKKEVIKNCSFNKEISIAEDLLFLIDAFMQTNQFLLINRCYYNYVRYNNSAIGRYKPDLKSTNEKFHKEIVIRLNSINFFDDNYVRYSLNRFYMYTTTISNIMKNKKSNNVQKRKEIKNVIRDFGNDKFMCTEMIHELSYFRRMIYCLMRMNAITLILLLFKMKNKMLT